MAANYLDDFLCQRQSDELADQYEALHRLDNPCLTIIDRPREGVKGTFRTASTADGLTLIDAHIGETFSDHGLPF